MARVSHLHATAARARPIVQRLWAAAMLCILPLSSGALADTPASFSSAKRLASRIYQSHPVTFYCGCPIQSYQKKLIPDLRSCGYHARKQMTRASRVEWEHVVPAWAFGHQLQCWQKGGRRECRRHSTLFRHMEADLFNLVPAVGEINGDRSNFRFGVLPQVPDMYGECDFKVDFKSRIAEPPEERRGMIARIYLYMADHYPFSLSRQQRKLYQAWSRLYPVTQWELQRNRLIRAIQGWGNAYVVRAAGQRANPDAGRPAA